MSEPGATEKKTYSEDYVKDLRNEAANWRTKLRDVESKLEQFKDFDIDEYKKLVAEKKKNENKRKLDEGKFNELLQQEKDNYAKELKKLQDLIEEKDKIIQNLDSTIQTNTVNSIINEASTKYGAISPVDIQLRLEREILVEKNENGERQIFIVDDKKNKRLNSKGKPLTIEDRILEMKEAESTAHLFSGGVGGSGTHSDTTATGPGVGEMTAVQRAARDRQKLLKR